MTAIGYAHGAGVARDVGLPLLAVVGAVLLPFSFFLPLYIVIGHAHYFTAYRYQVRGKRVTAWYVLTALALAAGTAWFLSIGAPFVTLMFIVGPLFAMHYAYDEFTLHGETRDAAAWLLIGSFALLFVVLIAGVVIPTLPSLHGYTHTYAYAYGAIIMVYALIRTLMRVRPSRTERYVWLVTVALVGLALFGFGYQVLGIMILLHFINWYIGYGARLMGNPARARAYWMEVFVTLGVVVALFGIYLTVPLAPLAVFFTPTAAHLWAIAHVVLSFVAAQPRKVVVA